MLVLVLQLPVLLVLPTFVLSDLAINHCGVLRMQQCALTPWW